MQKCKTLVLLLFLQMYRSEKLSRDICNTDHPYFTTTTEKIIDYYDNDNYKYEKHFDLKYFEIIRRCWYLNYHFVVNHCVRYLSVLIRKINSFGEYLTFLQIYDYWTTNHFCTNISCYWVFNPFEAHSIIMYSLFWIFYCSANTQYFWNFLTEV